MHPHPLLGVLSDPPLEECPKCGKGPVQKLVSSPAFQFKGSGWYITDYARKSESPSSSPGSDSGDKSTTTTETPAAAAGETPKAKDPAPADKPAPAAATKDK